MKKIFRLWCRFKCRLSGCVVNDQTNRMACIRCGARVWHDPSFVEWSKCLLAPLRNWRTKLSWRLRGIFAVRCRECAKRLPWRKSRRVESDLGTEFCSQKCCDKFFEMPF